MVKLGKMNRRAYNLVLLNQIAEKAEMLLNSLVDNTERTGKIDTARYLLETLKEIRSYVNNDEYVFLEI